MRDARLLLALLTFLCGTSTAAVADSPYRDAKNHASFQPPVEWRRVEGDELAQLSKLIGDRDPAQALFLRPDKTKEDRAVIAYFVLNPLQEFRTESQIEEYAIATTPDVKMSVWNHPQAVLKIPAAGKGVYQGAFHRVIWRTPPRSGREGIGIIHYGKASTVMLVCGCSTEKFAEVSPSFLATAATLRFDKGFEYRALDNFEAAGVRSNSAVELYVTIIIAVGVGALLVTQFLIVKSRKKRRVKLTPRRDVADLGF